MLILQDAFQVALDFLAQALTEGRPKIEIVIMSCTETEDGWMFGFDSREFAEGKTSMKWVVGVGPVMVPKSGEPPYFMTVFDYLARRSDKAPGHPGVDERNK